MQSCYHLETIQGKYSDTIVEIITNSEPRFAVGIFGGWGTGKTTLMSMIKSKLDENDKIITVWFEAWRYEREKNLAVIPFLRTFKFRLDEIEKSNKRGWSGRVKRGVIETAAAFVGSTKISGGILPFFSVETDLSKARDSLEARRNMGDDNEIIYYHATHFLKKALEEVRKVDESRRIVVFIDDLDRCFPDKALEVLESVKSLFDIDGIIFVIAMDSNSIETYVKNKYGGNTTIKGVDYLQKIVQLPFQVPTWKEGWKDEDISKSIEKIVSTELKDYPLMSEIRNNLNLIVKGVQLNPREIKRFVNSVILAESVFFSDDETWSIRELLAVQALSFRNDWKNFLDIITPDDSRQKFLTHYKEFGKRRQNQNIIVPTLEEASSETSQKGIEFFEKIQL